MRRSHARHKRFYVDGRRYGFHARNFDWLISFVLPCGCTFMSWGEGYERDFVRELYADPERTIRSRVLTGDIDMFDVSLYRLSEHAVNGCNRWEDEDA